MKVDITTTLVEEHRLILRMIALLEKMHFERLMEVTSTGNSILMASTSFVSMLIVFIMPRKKMSFSKH